MDNLFYNLARRNNPAIRDRSSPQEHSRRASPGTTSAFARMVRQLITTFMTINRGLLFHRLLPYFLLLCFLVASAFIYLSSQTSTPAQAAWYNTGGTWLYRKPITIDHTKVSGVASSTLSSFPVLVSVTDTQLKSTSNGGLVASSTGADILFTTSDGTTLLDYEIESYASTTGQLIAWVNIPILSAVTDTTIYEYFGNASAPAETPGNITGTWDYNYKGVWHLGQSSGTLYDSTASANNGTASGTVTYLTSGKIGNGASVAAGTTIQLGAANSILFGATYTISVWMKDPNIASSYWHQIFGNSFPNTQMNTASYDGLRPLMGNSGYVDWGYGTGSIANNTWTMVTGTRDASRNIKYYINGSSAGTGADPGYVGYLGIQTTGNLTLGGYNANGVAMSYDQAEVSYSVRSADWIKTEYNNQSSPSTFYAYGAIGVQNRAAGTAGVAVVNRGTGIAWYNSSWSYRKPITIDHTKVSGVASS